jgi:dGTPase
MCARTLASVLKYDREIPLKRDIDPKSVNKPCKGYYASESALVSKIKSAVIGDAHLSGPFKTLECQIMDVADDIAYSTYDLEDAFKARFLAPIDLLAADNALLSAVVEEMNRDADPSERVDNSKVRGVIIRVFEEFLRDSELDELLRSRQIPTNDDLIAYLSRRYRTFMRIANVGYVRTKLTSTLVGDFIAGVTFEPNEEMPALSRVDLDAPTRMKVEVLKRFSYVSLIMSPRLKVAERRGQEIVTDLFECLTDDGGHNLLPDDFRSWYDAFDGNEAAQKRVVCDFIAGMTDRYFFENTCTATPRWEALRACEKSQTP